MVIFCHYWGSRGHESHIKFAESIGATFFNFYTLYRNPYLNLNLLGKLLKDDVFISEGFSPIFLLYVIKSFFKDKKIVALFADGMPYVFSMKPEWYFNEVSGVKRFLKRFYVYGISSKLFKCIDAGIAVSELVRKYVLKLNQDIKVEIVHPYITNEKYHDLIKISPNLETHNILSIGNPRSYKGLDILIEAFSIVKNEIKDANLFIRSNWFSHKSVKGVKFLDFMPKLSSIFKNVSLYVQPSRFDPFSISVLESMLSGVPAVITNMVGSKDVVEEVCKDFIRKVDAEDLAEGILKYFDLSISEKNKISKKCKEIAREFDERTCIKRFKDRFSEILKYLNK
jgi:glycosyltransferase involved in cell wall biosynthesis